MIVGAETFRAVASEWAHEPTSETIASWCAVHGIDLLAFHEFVDRWAALVLDDATTREEAAIEAVLSGLAIGFMLGQRSVREERLALREALLEARPYVNGRVDNAGRARGEEDWRSETARDVLGRVNAALAGAG